VQRIGSAVRDLTTDDYFEAYRPTDLQFDEERCRRRAHLVRHRAGGVREHWRVQIYPVPPVPSAEPARKLRSELLPQGRLPRAKSGAANRPQDSTECRRQAETSHGESRFLGVDESALKKPI
jgi:hypothetical protein